MNASTRPRDSDLLFRGVCHLIDDKQSDVFLLGAGFARAISPAMPLLQDLAQRVLGAAGRRTRVPREVASMMRENFAHALSYLEQAKPWLTEADNLRHRALFLELSNAIARDLDATVERVVDEIGGDVPSWVEQLIRHWHEHRSTVLTLNYDTLIETIAASLPIDGSTALTAHQLYPPLLTDAGLRSSGVQAEPPVPSFRLLKLHGSTNWYFSGRLLAQGEPIYFVPPLTTTKASSEERRRHAFRMKAVADKYPLLVPPVYDKTALLTHETIRALWFEAGDALGRARRVICMGYSLPESDLTMKHFLRTTCRRGARIEVVDPSAEARRNFERFFRGTGVHVRQHAHGAATIARFVGQLHPPS